MPPPQILRQIYATGTGYTYIPRRTAPVCGGGGGGGGGGRFVGLKRITQRL